ncbi:MAG TPA: hypothetical protein VNQ90_04800 [Chthoniobacteraceae bacterium]|nr:hypothetical protein [Chthoniobacteraceae bacterium]
MNSREFAVCRWYGKDDGYIEFFAPITRDQGVTWIHVSRAFDSTLESMKSQAARIYEVTGSLVSPKSFKLIYDCSPSL